MKAPAGVSVEAEAVVEDLMKVPAAVSVEAVALVQGQAHGHVQVEARAEEGVDIGGTRQMKTRARPAAMETDFEVVAAGEA